MDKTMKKDSKKNKAAVTTTADAVTPPTTPPAPPTATALPTAMPALETAPVKPPEQKAFVGQGLFEKVEKAPDGAKKLEGLKLSVPTFQALMDLDKLATTVAGKVEAAKKIQGSVADALKFLLDFHRAVATCKDRTERRFVLEEGQGKEAQANEHLSQVLGLKGGLRTVAALAFLKTVLTMDYKHADEVHYMLKGLVAMGILVQSADKGTPITIGYLHYKISPDFGLDAEDIAEVGAVVGKLSNHIKTLERQRREAMTKQMEAEADITLDEALEGKNGKCLVHVPSETFFRKVVDEATKQETQVKDRRGGGNVYFDFQPDSVVALKASGSVERLIADIARQKVSVPRHMLGLKKEEMTRGSLARSVGREFNLDREKAWDYAGNLMTLWHMLRRGIEDHQSKKQILHLKKAMEVEADITMLQFFGLNGSEGHPKDGTALIEYGGKIKLRSGRKLFNPFLLVTRVTEDDKAFFEVAGVPPHLQDVFGQFEGKRFPMDGNYQECPELGDLLDEVQGQQEMAAATATK